jgi:signal transduction histidine kinase
MRPALLRRVPGIIAAVGFLSMVVFAVQLWRASVAHRRASLAMLDDLAGVALDRYASSTESLIRMAGIPLLYPVDAPAGTSHGRMAELRDILYITRTRRDDACHCLTVVSGDLYFSSARSQVPLDIVLDRTGHAISAPAWLPGVIGVLDTLTGHERRIVLLSLNRVPGRPFVVATVRAARDSLPRSIYGVIVPREVMAEQVFARAFETTRLVPRLLPRDVSNADYLTLSVTSPGGDSVFRSAVSHASPHGDALILDPGRGSLRYSAILNPAYVDRLVAGGLPSLPAVRIVLLLALGSGALAAMAWTTSRSVELVRLRTDFTSSVTHELRTPLTLIRLSAETLLLGRARSPADHSAALEGIVAEARRMQQLVDNVLHFSRAERRILQVRLADVPVDSFLEETVAGFAPLVAELGVSVRRYPAPGLVVRADPEALRLVLFNLLDNAARYGHGAGGIDLEALRSPGGVTLAVSDTGPGIPAAARERVWRPFERLASAAENNAPGSGLGLAVVRELVVAMGGSCRIAPVSRGCRVEIVLPAPG